MDVLLNNAAQLGPYPEQEFGSINYDFMAQAWAVNAMGPLKVAEAFHKHVAASQQKRIVSSAPQPAARFPATGAADFRLSQ